MINLHDFILLLLVAGIGSLTYLYFLNRIIVKTEKFIRQFCLFSVFFILVVLPLVLSFITASFLFEYVFLMVCIIFLVVNGLVTIILKSRYFASPPDFIDDAAESEVIASKILTTRMLRKKHYSLCFPGINGAIKIVQITDLHITDKLPLSYFMNVMKHVETEEPDVFIITGDFLDRERHLHLLSQMLKPVGKFGNIYINGNHDIRHGKDKIEELLGNIGFHKVKEMDPVVKINDDFISFKSCTAPWEKCNIPAIDDKADINICLSHTADNIFKLASEGFDIVFTGHYHAGQWRLPLIGSVVVPSLYGRLFDIGHYMVNKTHLYVNSGIGLAHPAFRLFCNPEIIVLNIEN